ncbi:hypothetical protein M011DRAFT_456497 [Sporormia fimetaria CBS 119925]|uniref:Uncharacterized protein n=1 Tax=Sporormia fimetaria CBS 119925 TaxID=1340428 RepID=A0A6A6VIT2_9PLEO|nr:hypothetical protein M011DRAFT_456497 [Sporormia fimetaria CBS 119925]
MVDSSHQIAAAFGGIVTQFATFACIGYTSASFVDTALLPKASRGTVHAHPPHPQSRRISASKTFPSANLSQDHGHTPAASEGFVEYSDPTQGGSPEYPPDTLQEIESPSDSSYFYEDGENGISACAPENVEDGSCTGLLKMPEIRSFPDVAVSESAPPEIKTIINTQRVNLCPSELLTRHDLHGAAVREPECNGTGSLLEQQVPVSTDQVSVTGGPLATDVQDLIEIQREDLSLSAEVMYTSMRYVLENGTQVDDDSCSQREDLARAANLSNKSASSPPAIAPPTIDAAMTPPASPTSNKRKSGQKLRAVDNVINIEHRRQEDFFTRRPTLADTPPPTPSHKVWTLDLILAGRLPGFANPKVVNTVPLGMFSTFKNKLSPLLEPLSKHTTGKLEYVPPRIPDLAHMDRLMLDGNAEDDVFTGPDWQLESDKEPPVIMARGLMRPTSLG